LIQTASEENKLASLSRWPFIWLSRSPVASNHHHQLRLANWQAGERQAKPSRVESSQLAHDAPFCPPLVCRSAQLLTRGNRGLAGAIMIGGQSESILKQKTAGPRSKLRGAACGLLSAQETLKKRRANTHTLLALPNLAEPKSNQPRAQIIGPKGINGLAV